MPRMYSLDWPYVTQKPQSTAQFKTVPDDFHVTEIINEEFSHSGEHLFLKIEKKGVNTEDVIKALSKQINKPTKLISYAGLKDRQAHATQWISVHVPGEQLDGIEQLSSDKWQVIQCARHHKKIRPGFLKGNQFFIRLRKVTQIDELIKRIEHVKSNGVPNYFGEQRFGREEGNLYRAEEILIQQRKVKDRFLKGIYYSAARSWIFNQILGYRVHIQSWNTPLTGDVMQLAGSNSLFQIDSIEETIRERIQNKDISPASPLPGKGKMMAKKEALEGIQSIYSQWGEWIRGLEQHGLEQSWRANILHVIDLQYQINDETVELNFQLQPGAYATTLLRELVDYSTPLPTDQQKS